MSSPRAEPGFGEALRQFGATLLAGLHSRLALAGLELDEARQRLVVTLLLVVAALFAACVAVLALSLWVALLFWDRAGPAVVGWLALAYALLAALLATWLRVHARATPPLLADTLAELRRDADALRPGGPR